MAGGSASVWTCEIIDTEAGWIKGHGENDDTQFWEEEEMEEMMSRQISTGSGMLRPSGPLNGAHLQFKHWATVPQR